MPVSNAVIRNRRKAKQTREAKRAMVRAYKLARGCGRCGYKANAAALQFHHDDPTGKVKCVAHGAALGWKRLKAEIAKCSILCANCHAEQTWPATTSNGEPV